VAVVIRFQLLLQCSRDVQCRPLEEAELELKTPRSAKMQVTLQLPAVAHATCKQL